MDVVWYAAFYRSEVVSLALMTCSSNDSHIWPKGASAKGLAASRPSDDIHG